jgi:cardiolipin synthase
MFAEFWDAFSNDKIPNDLLLSVAYEKVADDSNGYILPYYDSPMRDEAASNVLFTEMLSMATDYIWFYTPYLMLGDALMDAFVRAAQRGVDVRIMMPGIPDKKMVYRIGRSYYEELLRAGVKIYEYTPGFVHAKAFVMDDKVAGIGTVNLDYRSLFLHFECYSIFYKANLVEDLKKDYAKTLEECEQRTLENLNRTNKSRIWDSVLRLIAPLL